MKKSSKRTMAFFLFALLSLVVLDVLGLVLVSADDSTQNQQMVSRINNMKFTVGSQLKDISNRNDESFEEIDARLRVLQSRADELEGADDIQDELDEVNTLIFRLRHNLNSDLEETNDDLDDQIEDLESEVQRLRHRLFLLEGGTFY